MKGVFLSKLKAATVAVASGEMVGFGGIVVTQTPMLFVNV